MRMRKPNLLRWLRRRKLSKLRLRIEELRVNGQQRQRLSSIKFMLKLISNTTRSSLKQSLLRPRLSKTPKLMLPSSLLREMPTEPPKLPVLIKKQLQRLPRPSNLKVKQSKSSKRASKRRESTSK